MPKVAFAPLFVAWLGFGIESKVALSAFIATFPVVVGTAAGLHYADENARMLFKSMGASRLQTLIRMKPKLFITTDALENAMSTVLDSKKQIDYVISPPEQASLSIADSTSRFPVHRVYCVGRNYAAHAVEMGHDPDKEPPFFFQKNPDNLVPDAHEFPYPSATKDVHHEIELLVALKSGGDNIPTDRALDCVFGYGVSLDMTRRDLQGEMKKLGRPWEIGKAFEMSAPAGPVLPVSQVGHPESGDIWLKVNDELRQSGDLNQMIWKTSEMISILSTLFTLQAGDVILTGTPSGVGPVQRGDRMHGHIAGVGDLRVLVS